MSYWYYMKGDLRNGPIKEADLKQAFSTGAIVPETMVWNKDLTEWTVARDVKDLVPADFCPPQAPSEPPPYSPSVVVLQTHAETTTNGNSPPALTHIPAEIEKRIRNAWIAGIVSGCITILFTILAVSGVSIGDFSAWSLIDAVFFFGLSYGIYRKSRVCAVTMVLLFFIGKIMQFSELKEVPASMFPVAIIFLYFYLHGAVATFQYHGYLRGEKHVSDALTLERQTPMALGILIVLIIVLAGIWIYAAMM
jgi:hypothetical protein